MKQPDSLMSPNRRGLLKASLGAATLIASPVAAFAVAPPGFDQWRDGFRARALAKGISDATYTRVMGRIEPDMSVFKQMQKQPEFNEQIWQYVNRRASDWRIIAGKEALKKNEALFARIEQDFGVERGTLLALWGVESAYGDPLVQQNHMRPVPARAFWSIAANIAAAIIGATRCARPALLQAAAGPIRRGQTPVFPAPTASRFRNPMHPRRCGCRCKA